jgi:hypothetical protein
VYEIKAHEISTEDPLAGSDKYVSQILTGMNTRLSMTPAKNLAQEVWYFSMIHPNCKKPNE